MGDALLWAIGVRRPVVPVMGGEAGDAASEIRNELSAISGHRPVGVGGKRCRVDRFGKHGNSDNDHRFGQNWADGDMAAQTSTPQAGGEVSEQRLQADNQEVAQGTGMSPPNNSRQVSFQPNPSKAKGGSDLRLAKGARRGRE